MYRFEFEWKILDFFHEINCDFLTALFYFITEFGAEEIPIFLIAALYYCYNKDIAKKLGYICINSMMLNSVAKSLFLADRPFQYEGKEYLRVLNESLDGATGTSFPSGHSQSAGALYTSLIILFKNKWIRIISAILLVLVPISRVYLGVHFPGDIVVGLLLGVGTALLGAFLINYFKKKGYSLYILYGISLAIFLPFVIFNINNPLVSATFKAYGLFIGFVLGCLIEEKKVNFDYNVKWYYKLIRIIIGAFILIGIKSGVKVLFNMIDFIPGNILDLIRYALMSLFGIGIFPLIFTKYEKKGVKND
ncbi:MAG: phosphatase PAP2 family protein [Bacilli bacterium]|nr:phosphatase PAP2 family protein [Bacilli bacterium]